MFNIPNIEGRNNTTVSLFLLLFHSYISSCFFYFLSFLYSLVFLVLNTRR